MKQPVKTINIEKLDAIIKRWKINIPMISKEIGMPESTFKRKANPADTKYNFTLLEYCAVLRAISTMARELATAARKDLKKYNI